MKLSEQKRLQILSAAEKAFSEQGLDSTSMDYVAKLAQVSKRTVYNHFPSKQDLFQAILSDMMRKMEQVGQVAFDPNKEIRGQLREIAEQEVALLTSDNFIRLGRTAFIQMLKDSSLAAKLSSEAIGCEQHLACFIRSACECGVLAVDDPDFAGKQFVYHLKSFVFYPKLYGFSEVPESEQQDMIEKTLDMFLAQYLAE